MNQCFEERGYLNDKYRIFYLNSIPQSPVPLHYHDFDKILILLKGNIHYMIEDREYEVNPLDIVIVKAGEIHKPVLNKSLSDQSCSGLFLSDAPF